MIKATLTGRVHWSVSAILVILVFAGLFFLSTPGAFNMDPLRIVEALHKYHDQHGQWPDTLEQLKPSLPDVDIKSKFRSYVYLKKDGVFLLKCHSGLESGSYYRSDTGEWHYMNYHPSDPDYKKYLELVKTMKR